MIKILQLGQANILEIINISQWVPAIIVLLWGKFLSTMVTLSFLSCEILTRVFPRDTVIYINTTLMVGLTKMLKQH